MKWKDWLKFSQASIHRAIHFKMKPKSTKSTHYSLILRKTANEVGIWPGGPNNKGSQFGQIIDV